MHVHFANRQSTTVGLLGFKALDHLMEPWFAEEISLSVRINQSLLNTPAMRVFWTDVQLRQRLVRQVGCMSAMVTMVLQKEYDDVVFLSLSLATSSVPAMLLDIFPEGMLAGPRIALFRWLINFAAPEYWCHEGKKFKA
jgi:hypothetical protein